MKPEKSSLSMGKVNGGNRVSREEEELKFGWGPLIPRCLQKINTIRWFVVWLCLFGFVEGAAVNGIVNIVLTTLETRFSLPSSQSGLIVSATDIGAILFVLFVSYAGSKGHRPKWIAVGCAIMGVGSVIFSLSHFIADQYDYRAVGETANISYVCDPARANTCLQDSSSSSYLYLFMLGQAIHGIGFTPMFTLGTAYVDDNAKSESTAVHLGIIYAITALGVGGGYIGGGQFLTLYVDFNTVDNVDLTPVDPRWVGAWWVGFIITAVFFFIFTVPLAGYPKNLPGTSEIRAARETDTDQKAKEDKRTITEKLIEFPKSIVRLVSIPTYTLVILGACAETLVIGGLAAFAPKILEEKFDILPSDSGFIMGAVTLLGGAGGMVLGGVLIKRFKFGVVGMVRLCVLMSLLAIVIGAGFFIGCPEIEFAGVTTSYGTNKVIVSPNLDATCNTGCECDSQKFEPVCGSDSILYFTPCHAGCTYDYVIDPKHLTKIYNNCTCVSESIQQLSTSGLTGTALTGKCSSSCDVIYLFVLLLFIAMLMTFTTVTPASMAILRCVPDDLRALGLGLQWVCLRLLGTIPGPVLTGSVIDSACALWQDICGSRGSCWFYDRFEMSWRLFAWWVAVKIFSAVTFFASSKLHKPLKEDTDSKTTDYDADNDIDLTENKDTMACENVIHGLAHM
ncbi:solute carrier organic anion transporter family member 4A1-like [Mercenaria mercenaria]|uniref:solute carrier organic anion transporter family member 4A1-like n=1 Tax=Mercenaria mercenaria TaxID=6596 RepID=UPI00234EB425|nr:solute carrier organic anion transporter family member 4A1-like [Mercenaria mercenaria]